MIEDAGQKSEKFVPIGECPAWHHDKCEDILAWAGARVEYEEEFYSPKHGTQKIPELAHWVLLDGRGWIGLDFFRSREDEKYAHIAGAMFVYLNHVKKVPTAVADVLCVLYGKYRKSMDEFERSRAAAE